MQSIPVGLQLYTVRDAAAKDMAGTLRRVAEIGYKWVEFAGYGNLAYDDVKRVVGELGLSVSSAHVGIDVMQKSPAKVIDEARGLGAEYVVIPWVGEEWRGADGYKRLADLGNELGATFKAAGLTLCYHNHDFEFQRYGDQSGFEILWGRADGAVFQSELDLYWVKRGGDDPAAWVQRLSGRVPLLHLKDMADDAKRSFAAVGTGVIDFAAIFAAAGPAGSRRYIVEQDVCPGDPFASIAESLANLRAWGVA
ncbi:MAG TPA: sugar phosphate isomerase/epimerase [Limnochordia bacterium]|nr:sugar phosphate isomerase/epimerase [Limnochordia bacterium]